LPEALADLSRAIEIDPKHAMAFYNRGQVEEKLGDRGKAIADYRRALTLDPAYPEPAEALKHLDRAAAPPPAPAGAGNRPAGKPHSPSRARRRS
jgi:tetratricopeptide (TPR) repeat protein